MNDHSESESNSVVRRLTQVQQHDEDAMTAWWDRYFPDLARLAGKRLASLGVPQRAFDGHDVALSALGSFFSAVQKNRFTDLRDEEGILRLLRKMTLRKVIDYKRKAESLRAGGGKVGGESAFGDGTTSSPGINGFTGEAPTPVVITVMGEECQRLFALLGDEKLQTVARLRLEGYSNAEIAAELGCSLATVERLLRGVRACWSRE